MEEVDRSKPMASGYYWFPVLALPAPTWTVLTCHELGCDADVGHARLSPLVLVRLAQAWPRDAGLLRKRLNDHYTGVPRGRVARCGKVYWVSHGGDSPIGAWEEAVIRSFNLQGRAVRPAFDEHELQLPYDVRAVARLLGSSRTLAERETGSPDT
jgi:hypothetical protein